MKEKHSKEARAAASRCRPGACTSENKQAFRGVIFWYVSERASQTRSFYTTYGEDGLRFIQSLYGHSDDYEILASMRELHGAGLFEPTHAGYADVERMLLTEGRELLPPCAATDPEAAGDRR